VGRRFRDLEEAGRLDDLRRDLDDVRAPNRAGGEGRANGHAAAESDDRDVLRVSMEQHGQQPEQPLRQHVAGVGGVHLAVDGQRQWCAVSRRTLTVAARHFLVSYLQVACAQDGVEILGAEIRRVLVCAAGKERVIPTPAASGFAPSAAIVTLAGQRIASKLGLGNRGLGTKGTGDLGTGDWGTLGLGDWGTGGPGTGGLGIKGLGTGGLGTRGLGLGDWGLGDWGLGDWGLGDWGLRDRGLGDWGLGTGDSGTGDSGTDDLRLATDDCATHLQDRSRPAERSENRGRAERGL